MSDENRIAEAEGAGETVGEAKWQAVRELERLHPGVDRQRVSFEVLTEGERGLLGVGTTPARVRARAELTGERPSESESELAMRIRGALERIAAALGAPARVDVAEDEEALRATVSAPASEVGFLIGRNGRTIDAVHYVVSAIAHRADGGDGKTVDVDAGGYRARRRERLAATARDAADRALASRSAVALPPMTAVERKIVHTALAGVEGIQTQSEGDDPYRCVVVQPGDDSGGG